LKTKLANLTEEVEELNTHDNKRKELLKQTKELVNNLQTQLEETKESEEVINIQLTKREESCHMLELEAIDLKRIQLENKEEIKRLKTKVFDLTKDMDELKKYDKTIKCKEVLDEIEETIINLKTQLEHAKEVEEALKIHLTKKEETCHMLKLEIVNLKKMNEKTNKTVKFQNSSAILDKIWNNQRSAHDKLSLGYNKKEDSDKWRTIYKHVKGSYFSKVKGAITNRLQTMNFVKERRYIIKKKE
jgi:chromosome segregation ATPase